jgi:hypothetical protein
MDNNEKLHLQKMLQQNDFEDQTNKIRELKHSEKIKDDLRKILKLRQEKDKYSDEEYTNKCISECTFLYTYYTDIFNRLKKDELDLKIFLHFLKVLEQIENNEVDQHEASFIIGKLLKEMYVDSALRKADNIDKKYSQSTQQTITSKNISWKEYKKIHLN